MSKAILTGLQSSGAMHIGNYVGALAPMRVAQTKLQADDRFYMFVPDLHVLTKPENALNLAEKTLSNLKHYQASGVDFQNLQTTIWRQSRVSAHAELAWILSCFTHFGEASRMTQFKDKVAKDNQQKVSVGMFSYPILMAADILLYDIDYVPVGDDQRQHLELARDLSIRINNKFQKEVFKVPKTWSEQLAFAKRQTAPRIMSLQNPTNKMSKSEDDTRGTIELLDEPKVAVKKIMSAETDSLGNIAYDTQNQPGVSNLLQIHALFSDKSVDELVENFAGSSSYGDLKKTVAAAVEKFLTEYQERFYAVDEQAVYQTIIASEERAKKRANEKLQSVMESIGL